ncbi:MAG: metal-sensitive transcriptional regulator [Verrucomicrobiota bacterium]
MQRTGEVVKPLADRVNRIAGQVKGVGAMIASGRDCPEILHTISAVHASLRSLEAKLLEDHVKHCVHEAAAHPRKFNQRLDELIALYKRRLS